MKNEIVNDKKEDEYRDKHGPSKEFVEKHRHYCKTCKDSVCCNKGKDIYAYCCGGPEE